MRLARLRVTRRGALICSVGAMCLAIVFLSLGVKAKASGILYGPPLFGPVQIAAVPQPSPSPSPTPKPATVNPTEPVGRDDDVIRIDTDLTNLQFTAVDGRKRFLTSLTKDDVRVFEDSVQQEIFTFQAQADLPLSLAVLVDVSGSQERTLPDEKDAARIFVDSVMRAQKDEVAVVTFTGETTLELGLSGNVQRVKRSLDAIRYVNASGVANGRVVGTPPISGRNQEVAGSTAIWDAIWVTSNEVLSESSDKTRRAIILISDGVNTYGQKKLQDAVAQALKNDVLVFSVGIGDNYRTGIDKSALTSIAERTGGRAYFPRDEEQLHSAFEQIQAELRSEYLIAYAPTNRKRDGTYRQIKLELVNAELQKTVKLAHRQGYFAKDR